MSKSDWPQIKNKTVQMLFILQLKSDWSARWRLGISGDPDVRKHLDHLQGLMEPDSSPGTSPCGPNRIQISQSDQSGFYHSQHFHCFLSLAACCSLRSTECLHPGEDDDNAFINQFGLGFRCKTCLLLLQHLKVWHKQNIF